MNLKHIEVFPDKAGKWRFHAVALNNEIVAPSQAYASKWSAKRGASRLFPGVPVVERGKE